MTDKEAVAEAQWLGEEFLKRIWQITENEIAGGLPPHVAILALTGVASGMADKHDCLDDWFSSVKAHSPAPSRRFQK